MVGFLCGRRKSMRNHHMTRLCAVVATCPNHSRAAFGLWIDMDDCVLIAPSVAHSVAYDKG